MKKFLTIQEQIDLLKARKLVIDNEQEAASYLLSNNYYNIINGYGKYFPQSNDTYSAGTSFDEISKLYLFDKEIKQFLFQAILTAEAHLKAIFAHRFAETYKDIPYSYLNINCYDTNQVLSVVETISKLSKIISRYKKIAHSSISHYIKKHDSVPIWVLVNYLDFGELRYMLSSSTTSVKNMVAKDFSGFISQHISTKQPFPPEIMMSFIENINDVRNICAHNNRLLGYRCRRDCKYWAPLHGKYNIAASNERNSIYAVFLSLQCFLSIDEYDHLCELIRNCMYTRLMNNMRTITPSEILSTLGFPNDWFLGKELPASCGSSVSHPDTSSQPASPAPTT